MFRYNISVHPLFSFYFQISFVAFLILNKIFKWLRLLTKHRIKFFEFLMFIYESYLFLLIIKLLVFLKYCLIFGE